MKNHPSASIGKNPAIVVSGHTMALGVVRALGTMGVPVVVVHFDERDTAQTSKYVTAKIAAPDPERCEDEFIDVLTNSADRFGGGVLFPVSDEAQKFSYRLAEEAGVPSPKTIVPRSIEDVEEYGETIDYPCLLKPSQGHLFYAHFKRKMFCVEGIDQLLALYQQSSDAGLEVMLQELIAHAAPWQTGSRGNRRSATSYSRL